MNKSSSPFVARASLLLLTASSLAACAAQVTGDLFAGDGGSCVDDPAACADAHSEAAVHHDAGTHLIDAPWPDTSTPDSNTTFDSSTFDSSTFDSGVDSANVDSSTPDSSTTGVLVFDSIPSQSGSSSRGAGDACGTAISVHTTMTISKISVKNTLNGAGNVKFLIFSNGTLVYASPPKAFSVTGDSWKDSDPLTFTLVAGQTYGITGISDVASSTWDYDTVAENTAAISSLIQNPNVTNFTTPVLGSPGGADCGIRLYQ